MNTNLSRYFPAMFPCSFPWRTGRRTAVLLTLALGWLAAAQVSRAATMVWTNASGGPWNTANAWSPNTVPGAADTAIITNGDVTVTLSGSVTVSNIVLGTDTGDPVALSVNGQTLTLNGALTINTSGSFMVNNGDVLNGGPNTVLSGALYWTGGNLGGTLTLAANGNLNIVSANNHNLPGLILTNNGTVTWSTGEIRGGGGAVIYNNGTWNAQDNSTWDNLYGGGTTFKNSGTLQKSGGSQAGTTFLSGVVLQQLAGAIDVQANQALILQGGGTFTGGYTTTNDQGLIELNNGSFTLDGAQLSTNVVENNGSLTGANVIYGGLTWTSGAWNGSASETIAANATVVINSGGAHGLNSCIVTNNGTVNWVTSEISGGGNPGTFIYNNGVWNAEDDSTWDNNYGGAGTVFNSAGIFRKSGGNATTGATTFNNGVLLLQTGGAIDIQNGTSGLQLALKGGAQLDGGYVTTNSQGVINIIGNNFSINGTVTTTNVFQVAANLVGTNVLRGGFNWQNGSWNGAVVTLYTNCTLVINTANGNHNLSGTIITNYGSVKWSSDTLAGGANTVIVNYGLWEALDDQALNDTFGSPVPVFNNYGIFRKSGGTNSGQTLIGNAVNFNNAGVIDVQSGSGGLNLSLQGNDTFTGGYCTTNPGGMIFLATGNFNINGTVMNTNVIENPGNLTGTNFIQGGLVWQDGSWGNIVMTVGTNCTLVINTKNGDHTLSGVLLTNYGTVNWSSDTLFGGNGLAIQNYGVWNAQDDQTLNNYSGGSGTTFNNFGIFRKSGGTNTSATVIASPVAFNNAGVIDVQSGYNGLNVWLEGTDTFTGGYCTTNAGGTLTLYSGTATINGTVTTTNVVENSATLTGVNVLQGGFTWQDGVWPAGPVTIASNCLLLVVTPSLNHTLQGTIVTNYGVVDWNGDKIQGGSGSIIYNYGSWYAQDDENFFNLYGSGYTFNNYGTFSKTGTTGGSSQFQSSTTFNNRGKLDAQVGNISLAGTYSLANGTLNFGLNSATNSGSITLAGTAPLTGTVSANLNNGYHPTNGTSFTNLSYGSYFGSFTKTLLPAGYVWSTNYFPTYYVISVVTTQPVLTSAITGKTNLVLNWSTNSIGWRLEVQTNALGKGLGTNWVTYAGSANTNQETIPVVTTNGAVFFRMAYP